MSARLSDRQCGYALVLLLIISAALRWGLAAQGGQYFFGDEQRHDWAIRLYTSLWAGDWQAVRTIASVPGHILGPPLGALIVGGQHLLAQLTAYGDWGQTQNIGYSVWIAAAVLSLFSTLNVLLVFRLARITGASGEEALFGALLTAASNTLFYPARHLLPYGCALSAALGSLILGLGGSTRRRAILSGLFAGICYHTYNGYWYLLPAISCACGWWWRDKHALRLLAAWLLGAAIALAVPLLVASACGGREFWRQMWEFSATVKQGLFSEGWSLPWEFLWHSDGWLGFGVLAAIVIALVRNYGDVPDRVHVWIVVLAVSYGFLVLFCNGLERFVVYARTVIPFVPLFCLCGGWAIATLLERSATWRLAAIAVTVIMAAFQFSPHFGFVFPREFEIAVLRHYGSPKSTLSMAGSLYVPLDLPVTRPDLALVNAQGLYPVRGFIGFPEGKTLLRLQHPLSYKPFQYESHKPQERQLLRRHDISMRLIELSEPDSVPDRLPPAMRFGPIDLSTGK